MDLYFAGGRGHFRKSKTTYGISKLLFSYIELNTPNRLKNLLPYIVWFKNNGGKLFLDSGAYSAHSQGFKININEYISFVKKYRHYFDVIVSLDVIGNGELSLENYLDMRRAGCEYVMPVYHARDDPKYLKEYLKLADYIGIGAVSRLARNTKELIPKLDRIFRLIPENSNKKIHLFGITNQIILLRYALKIQSVDSTSWVSATRWGDIILHSGKLHRFKDAKNMMYGATAEKWLFYNVISLLNIEKTLNEYIEKHKVTSNVPTSSRN